jgi:hypothetical protein
VKNFGFGKLLFEEMDGYAAELWGFGLEPIISLT